MRVALVMTDCWLEAALPDVARLRVRARNGNVDVRPVTEAPLPRHRGTASLGAELAHAIRSCAAGVPLLAIDTGSRPRMVQAAGLLAGIEAACDHGARLIVVPAVFPRSRPRLWLRGLDRVEQTGAVLVTVHQPGLRAGERSVFPVLGIPVHPRGQAVHFFVDPVAHAGHPTLGSLRGAFLAPGKTEGSPFLAGNPIATARFAGVLAQRLLDAPDPTELFDWARATARDPARLFSA